MARITALVAAATLCNAWTPARHIRPRSLQLRMADEDFDVDMMLLETEFAPGMHLFIGATSKLSSERPGNGGFRIWKYNSKDEAAAEVCA